MKCILCHLFIIALMFDTTNSFALREWKKSNGIILKMSDDIDTGDLDVADDVFGAKVGTLPTVSSKLNFGDLTPQNIVHDLWIVGAGTLGVSAAKIWKSKNPSAKVIAETRTTNRHQELLSLGALPRLRESRSSDDDLTARNVLVCLPPSSSSDYVDEIHLACRMWAGPLGNGNLVFTSSTAVYGDSIGNIVNENFRLDTRSLRATK